MRGKDGQMRFPRLSVKSESFQPSFDMPTDEKEQEYVQLLEEEQREKMENKFSALFPDTGPYRRALYPKHMAFIRAGGKHKPMEDCPDDCDGHSHRERCLLSANRVGKTVLGAYEVTCHLTGEYPPWWKGKRFTHPISAWAAGDTNQTTRDIIQLELLGAFGNFGTGMIPKRSILHTTTKGGMAGAVETIFVRHASGGRSDLGLKSYDQGRVAFQGTNKHLIWLDEECPKDVYTECLIRTTTTRGIIILTFTPLNGMTEICRDFLGITSETDLDVGKAEELAKQSLAN
jgi:phage terminase large subunit-like protein